MKGRRLARETERISSQMTSEAHRTSRVIIFLLPAGSCFFLLSIQVLSILFHDLMMSQKIIFQALDALLPNSDHPQTAEIEVDVGSGKITAIRAGVDELALDPSSDSEILRLEKGLILLPGLLE